MRRPSPVLVLAALVVLLSAIAPNAATAKGLTTPPAIVGQVVDYSTGDPVPSTTLRLHSDDAGAPGAVVATAATDSNGAFSLTPPAADGTYWVEVVRNAKVQGGYVSDSDEGPSWVQFDITYAAPVAPGTRLGRVLDLPSFLSGVVVNAANGNPLSGIAVSLRAPGAIGVVVGSDTTNASGAFRIPVYAEEFAMKVNGSARSFENGWRGCHRDVVRTWGAACSVGAGRIGKTRLDHL